MSACQKIRVGLPVLALTYMPFYVAKKKGSQKTRPRSGIHSDEHGHPASRRLWAAISIFSPPWQLGFLAGSRRTAARGCAQFLQFTPWMLVTAKEINKPQDLIGKKVADFRYPNDGTLLDGGLVQRNFEITRRSRFIMTGGTASSFASWRASKSPAPC